MTSRTLIGVKADSGGFVGVYRVEKDGNVKVEEVAYIRFTDREVSPGDVQVIETFRKLQMYLSDLCIAKDNANGYCVDGETATSRCLSRFHVDT